MKGVGDEDQIDRVGQKARIGFARDDALDLSESPFLCAAQYVFDHVGLDVDRNHASGLADRLGERKREVPAPRADVRHPIPRREGKRCHDPLGLLPFISIETLVHEALCAGAASAGHQGQQ